MTTSVQSFGQWVRERRKERKLTQKALGQLIGYAEITIRQIEHDTYKLSRFVVESGVNYLSRDLDDREAIMRFALRQSAASGLAAQSIGSPLSATSFFGRESELAHIRTLLGNPECRCISIVGVGGIGKTRLAVRAVEAFATETAQVAWFVNLAGVETVDLMPSAIAKALFIARRTAIAGASIRTDAVGAG